MKLVLFSDLHLDSAFAWMGARDEQAARARRQGLRATLRRILDLAAEEHADAVFCGGSLYEHEHFTPDTVAFVQAELERVHPLPVYLAPGNHDWLGPSSLYAQARWSPNVHVFTSDRLERVELTDGLSLWGAAHRAPADTRGFLDGFHADGGGIHLALFHGSERGALAQQDEDKAPHAPFRAEQIPAAGLQHAFLSHFHRPSDAPTYTYPGNPDPLSFGEDGQRGAVIATVRPDGSIARERRRVASTAAHDLMVDITPCTGLQQIGDLVAATVNGLDGVARITLQGTLNPAVDLHLEDLYAFAPRLQAATFRLGRVYPPYDLVAISQELTVRGRFVQDVLAAGLPEDETRDILVTGLRALDGRSDLEVG